ncbi:hypothetical protein MVLG_02502 [Microbotryum lychnidis-dioicae p1A1 Lamole]|uniref:Uncharacterized protein n=1 Tax=Microbotryum lychnidis-dioicae (strain p1A1 Lamole / MvSl-1064) TaxID=683840 RepID=U5H5C7_USTV1|nr:hypothetical protein MVLG_02502 [Microbotryum lychnidis-dioicae p1A1 Lamole]|eukprot:KDE07282.1 hypothetical protein MVLG_02502 [Microbotryum lychnidis-dioicae p1A1 Lamole]
MTIPAPTPFGPLPTELEHLHSTFGYKFDPHLYLHLRLALASGASHLLVRLSSTTLDQHERAEAVAALVAQVDWICRTLYGLETNAVQCPRHPTSANAFLRSWLVPDPNHTAFVPDSASTRFTPRLATVPSTSRAVSPSTNPNPALANPSRSMSQPRSPLVGLDIDIERNASSSLLHGLAESGKPSILTGSTSRSTSHELRPDPQTQTSLDLTPRPTHSPTPDHSGLATPMTTSAVQWGPTSPTISSPTFVQRSKLDLLHLNSPTLTRQRRSTITVRSSSSLPLSSRRLPQVVILERMDRTSPRTQQGILKTLRERRITLDRPVNTSSGLGLGRDPNSTGTPTSTTTTTTTTAMGSGSGAGTLNGFLRSRRASEEVQSGEHRKEDVDWVLPEGFLCIAIVLEEGNRGDWGGLDRYLLDQFALSLTIHPDTYDFRHPPTHLSHPLSNPPISSLPFPSTILPSTFSDALINYQNDLISTLRHHPQLDGRFLTARASKDLTTILKTSIVLRQGHSVTPNQNEERSPPNPIVLPNNVIHVLLPVLGHRLRIRNAKDEKSVFWGSEIGALERRRAREGGVESVIRKVTEEV